MGVHLYGNIKGKVLKKKGLSKEGGSFTRGSTSCSAIILALCTLGQLFYVTALGQLVVLCDCP